MSLLHILKHFAKVAIRTQPANLLQWSAGFKQMALATSTVFTIIGKLAAPVISVLLLSLYLVGQCLANYEQKSGKPGISVPPPQSS